MYIVFSLDSLKKGWNPVWPNPFCDFVSFPFENYTSGTKSYLLKPLKGSLAIVTMETVLIVSFVCFDRQGLTSQPCLPCAHSVAWTVLGLPAGPLASASLCLDCGCEPPYQVLVVSEIRNLS